MSSVEKKEELFEILEEERGNYKQAILNLSYAEACSHIITVVEIKKGLNETCHENLELTSDLKKFYRAYLLSFDEMQHDYDRVDKEKILETLNYVDLDKRLDLLKYMLRLNRYHQLSYDNLFEKLLFKMRVSYYKSDLFGVNFFKLLIVASSATASRAIITILILSAASLIILYPVENPILHLYSVSYEKYSDVPLYNHFSNCIATLFGFKGISIVPLGIFALLVLIIGKIILTLVVVGYLVQKILDKIKFSE